jgi:hypothetical protein
MGTHAKVTYVLAFALLTIVFSYSVYASCCISPSFGCDDSYNDTKCAEFQGVYNDTASCSELDVCTQQVCCCGKVVAEEGFSDPVSLALCGVPLSDPSAMTPVSGKTCAELCIPAVPATRFNITGKVVDPTSNPLSNIAILNDQGNVLARTNTSGDFYFNIENGTYTLTAYNLSCENSSQTIEVNDNKDIEFTLNCNLVATYHCNDWSGCNATTGTKTRQCCAGATCNILSYPIPFYSATAPLNELACIEPSTNYCKDGTLNNGEECFYDPSGNLPNIKGSCPDITWCDPNTCKCVLHASCGDGQCLGNETCGSTNYCRTDCGECPSTCQTRSPSVYVLPVLNENNFKVDWTFQNSQDCSPFNFTIERCFGQSCQCPGTNCQFIAQLPGNARTYTDIDITPFYQRTNYTYYIKAQFDPRTFSVGNGTHEMGNMACIHAASRAFCYDANKAISNCDLNNFLSVQNCSNGTTQNYCTVDDLGNLGCMQQPMCNVCNGAYGSFAGFLFDLLLPEYGAGQISVTCKELEDQHLCYADRTNTTVNMYNSCNSVQSCYDYKSKNACDTDYCAKNDTIGKCEWITYDKESDIGICRPTDKNLQQCDDCTTFPYGCLNDACLLFGDTCYYTEHPPVVVDSCIGTIDPLRPNKTSTMTCPFYNDFQDCVNATSPARNASINKATNKLTASHDLFNLSTCKFINTTNVCIKDADDDNINDCRNIANIQELLKCLQDNEAPQTNLQMLNKRLDRTLSALRFNPTDNKYTGADIETFFAFSGYPSMTITALRNLLATDAYFDAIQKPATLAYFSKDKSHNLEEVQTISGLTLLDSVAFNFTMKKYAFTNPLIENMTFHNVNITFSTSRPVMNCSTKLTNAENPESAIIAAVKGLGSTFSGFTMPYTGLSSGQYEFFVACDDDVSTANDSYSFSLMDVGIASITPQGILYGPNQNSVPIELQTDNRGICKISQSTPYYNAMNITMASDATGTVHTYTATDMNDGLHIYYTACSLTSPAAIAQGFGQAAYYVVDKQAPATMLADDATNLEYLSETQETLSLRFFCDDTRTNTNDLDYLFITDPDSFGCDYVSYSLDNGEYKKIYYDDSGTGFISNETLNFNYQLNKGKHTLRYYSVDKGGNRESEKQRDVYLGLTRDLNINVEWGNQR